MWQQPVITGQVGKECTPRERAAFTLIEVLVVVAILALLVAILLPSLRRARAQAKLVACKANAQQIGHGLSQYQAENNDYVPIMYNYFAGLNVNQVNAHARNCWLSVALRRYDQRTSKLKQMGFDPEDRWTNARKDEYEERLMPDHYACPFERGKGGGYDRYWSDAKFDYWEWRGRFESYHTWFHDFVMIRNTPVVGGPQWPVGGGAGVERKGIPQYSAFTFNRRDDPDLQVFFQANGIDFSSELLQSYLHRRWVSWGPRDMRTYKTSSLSDMAVVYCAQGEHIQWPQTGLTSRLGRANVGSHSTGRGGGTNVIFADGHVDWVIGTRIGLP